MEAVAHQGLDRVKTTTDIDRSAVSFQTWFRNPSATTLNIMVYADGKLVRQGVMAGSLNDIEVPAHGLYVVKMSKDGLVKTIKIMK